MCIFPSTTSSSELSESNLLFFVPLGLMGESSSLSNRRRRPDAPEAAGAESPALGASGAAEVLAGTALPPASDFTAAWTCDAGTVGDAPVGAPCAGTAVETPAGAAPGAVVGAPAGDPVEVPVGSCFGCKQTNTNGCTHTPGVRFQNLATDARATSNAWQRGLPPSSYVRNSGRRRFCKSQWVSTHQPSSRLVVLTTTPGNAESADRPRGREVLHVPP